MGLGLLLIPSLAGYWFLQNFNGTRYETYRVSGYHLLFRSAIVGSLLAVPAHIITLFLNRLIPQLRCAWYAHLPVDYVDTAAMILVLAVALPPLINLFYSREKGAKRAAQKYGDLIELVIADAFERQKPVELSLKSGKSYIGLVLQSNITKRGASDVTLVPLASGYRSDETKELHITTNYAPVIDEWLGGDSLSDDDLQDFSITLPRSEVCSARPFDPELYQLFNQAGKRRNWLRISLGKRRNR